MELRDVVVYFKDGTTARQHIDASLYGYSVNVEGLAINHFAGEPPYDLHMLHEIYIAYWKDKEILKVAIEEEANEYIVKNINHVDYTIVYDGNNSITRETVRFLH